MSAQVEPSPLAGLPERLAGLTLRDERRLAGRVARLQRSGGSEDLARMLTELDRAEQRVTRRRAAVPAVSYPEQLPVSAHRQELLDAIAAHQVVVVAGETGSGKTTQLPKLCLELGRGVRGAIAHTQPRRLAARTVAQRIAEELDVGLGEAVGYSVRFNDRSGQDTLVRLLTDGLLLAEVQHDRDLLRYDTIIVDEAHERSLNIDFLLGYLARLLPRRPDLKLIITSATIDPGRFSAHFGGAPVVEVSGRTYPVEVRHRPPAEDQDAADLIPGAVRELLRDGPGDVLVFLSGEREIRDTADVLRGELRDDVEVLPLYARLAAAEQQRVFERVGKGGPAARRRRVVLATNVAETSLTVPGIGAVVDPGTARISRYSARLKVQRLPIEAISQASADQRKGRCGRVSDGICIRLYAQEDFDARPRYTDPEILRTSLAAVILQMAALGLGDVEAFPFLDPPDRRQVRDGVNLLHELGALDGGADTPERRLTPLGRRLARLPVDPRLGRMVLEADGRDCAAEVVVLAAALSIQDPRERPVEQRAQADQLHARFADEHSDFTSLLNLWRYLEARQEELSGNQFRKRCRAEHLNYLRVREWQDLAGQLRRSARDVGVTFNEVPAEPDDVHRALLAGLLSHLGLRDAARREYLGARGARFSIFPGSALARRGPTWVMAAELVETSRLFGRIAARIQPAWIEPVAEHLVRRSYAEPRWDRRRGAVVATERVTLYGLPVVAGRTVPYARLDPALARELFIRKALVERDWSTRHAFFAANGEMLSEVAELEHRARRRDLLVDDEALYAFFDARIPESVVSAAHFDRWWRKAGRSQPDRLTYTRELLLGGAALDDAGRPEAWEQDGLSLPLTYRFEPGADRDGVTLHAPLTALERLDGGRLAWLVPALRLELVTALLRALPKDQRRALLPIADTAERLVAQTGPEDGAPPEALAAALGRAGLPVDPAAFDLSALPAHLRMTVSVEDDEGRVVAVGTDLDELRAAVRPRLRAALAQATASLERTGMADWELDALPRAVALPGTGRAVRAYPALVDEGPTVGVRAFEDRPAQAAAMAAGTRRLLALTLPDPGPKVRAGLSTQAQLSLAAAPHGSLGAVLQDATAAALDALVAQAGGPAWDRDAFRALQAHVRPRLAAATTQVVDVLVAVLDAARDVQRTLDALPASAALAPARQDVARQLGRLVHAGMASSTTAGRLGDLVRYLHGARRRLERLGDHVAVDADRMALQQELEAAWQRVDPAAVARDPELAELPWLLEEHRLARLSPGATARPGASTKRIRALLSRA